MENILILDFGGQTTQLIARRIRDSGVYTRIVPGDFKLDEAAIDDSTMGIILSGSPYSVYEPGSPQLDPAVLSAGKPILGICYGLQRITEDLGGKIEKRHTREFGRAIAHIKDRHELFNDIPSSFTAWMSHGDSLLQMAPGFNMIAESEHGIPAAIALDLSSDAAKKAKISAPVVAIQFHPEVSHCEYGSEILSNFVYGICRAKPGWKVEYYLHEAQELIRERTKGKRPVLLLISGGVDSTVLGALLLMTIEADNVHLLYVDTGLMRNAETDEVKKTLASLGAKHIHIVHAENDFLSALKGKDDPEEKRRIIGDLFITIQNREIERLGLSGDYLLAQGTLYTDLIESGKGVGKKAQVIKSHHNVRSPLVEALRAQGRIVEPLSHLYKDEVRALGTNLGLPESIVWRHPFPGPGLAVRILGEVTKEKCDLLRQADQIYIEELRARGLYRKIWQAFCVLLPVRSVGVAGDAREYGYVLALRAIVSADGMTADVYPFEMHDLLEISSILTNRVRGIGRVSYDISSKPPATIEWE